MGASTHAEPREGGRVQLGGFERPKRLGCFRWKIRSDHIFYYNLLYKQLLQHATTVFPCINSILFISFLASIYRFDQGSRVIFFPNA